jgi:carbon-monoxide dehydrogenase catalytic subunit
VKLLAADLEEVVGARFAVEPDPEEAARLICRHIEDKREALGLPFVAKDTTPADKVA